MSAPPLHQAAKDGNTKMVRDLIQKGADVNAKDGVGNTSLHYAAYNGQQETAQVLLDNGAQVDAKDIYGKTSLLCAAIYGHQETAQVLLANGAQVDAKDNNGLTSLEYAASNAAMRHILTTHQQQQDAAAKKKAEAELMEQLKKATEREKRIEELEPKLQEKEEVKKENKEQQPSDFHWAAMHGHTTMLQDFIDKGADVNPKADDDWTALHLAVYNGHTETAQVLLANGAHVDAKDIDGNTPLDVADDDAMRQILTTHQQQQQQEDAVAKKKKAKAELVEQLKEKEVKKENEEQQPQPQHPRKTTDFTTDFTSQLGAGSQGTVFKGVDQVTKKPVAVKVQQGGNLDAEFIILAMLKHPNIVEVLHFDDGAGDAGFPNSKIFMEFVDAGSLDNRISPATPLPEENIRRYLSSLLQALAYIHAQQPPVWHRDIKPANMLLTKDDTIKLTDFGCSKVRGKTGQTMTAAAGTWVYMAPEACKGKPCATSDVWSLACSVVEMASGKKPWHETGLKDFPLGTHISKPNPPLNHYPIVPQTLSAPLQVLLRKMFANNPEHRGTAASHLKDPYFTNEIPSPAPTAGGSSVAASAFSEWLLGLEVDDEVRTILVQNQIDERSFKFLDSDDIKEMGIAMGPRKVLLNAIAEQKNA